MKFNREYLFFQTKVWSLVTEGCCVLSFALLLCKFTLILLVFSVTPFKIDQNKIGKVQNLGNEKRDIYKGPRTVAHKGHKNPAIYFGKFEW